MALSDSFVGFSYHYLADLSLLNIRCHATLDLIYYAIKKAILAGKICRIANNVRRKLFTVASAEQNRD